MSVLYIKIIGLSVFLNSLSPILSPIFSEKRLGQCVVSLDHAMGEWRFVATVAHWIAVEKTACIN